MQGLYYINRLEQGKYNVVGFIGENEDNLGMMIDNIPIIGTDNEIEELIYK